jgi:hypothetical protein
MMTREDKRLATETRITHYADRIRFLHDHIVCLRACLGNPDMVRLYLKGAEEELAMYGDASLRLKPKRRA